MTIDIIIPTYKPDEKFEKCLMMLKKQTVLPNKIIIVNTEVKYFKSSVANTINNLQLIHIRKEDFDHGGTRHMATGFSNSDIVMFMTQDAIPADEFLIENFLNAFENSDVSAVYARQLSDEKKNPIEYFTRQFNYPEKSYKKNISDLPKLGIKTFFCSNVCSAYKRSDYNQQGGFIRKTIFNEDMIMASKLIMAGKSIYYLAEAKVYHSHNYTAKEQFKRNFDLAVSQRAYGKPFTEVKSESEGVKLVMATMSYLVKKGKIYLIPKLIIQSFAKFLGYKLGFNYLKLPKIIIKKCTSNIAYWNFEKVVKK